MSEDVQALATPSMLDDKYRVDALLAVGGMGAVYRGTHTKLKKTVAIKVLKRELLGSPELVERFQREAVAASQIGHEGIIEVTDLGMSSVGDPFLVMELLEGRDLAQCLKELGPLAPGTAVRLCREILSALAAAHDKGIIHRDLKPDNVFVARRSRGEQLKIVDFGISRMPIEGDDSMRLTSTGMVMGTPYYMSPEQAMGDSKIGKEADLYSVGVILYELITGAVPFQATNYNALLHQILLGDYPSASQLASLPPELDAEIAKAMSIQPEARHRDARAFAAALEKFSEKTPSNLLVARDPNLDTFEDAMPALATAPTRASSVDQGIATFETELHVDGEVVGETLGDGSDTLKPVVTPVPDDRMPQRSRRSWGPIAAVLMLVVAGGTSAFFGLGSSDRNESRAASSGASQSLPSLISAPTTEAEAIGAEVPILEPITLTFAIAPHDAEVYVDGEKIEGTRIERPAGHFVIEVRRDGFQSQSKRIEAKTSQKLSFVLAESESKSAVESVAATPAKSERGGKQKRSKTRQGEGDAPKPPNPGNGRFVQDSPYDAP